METPYVQANTNGRLHDATTPSLCALDRGFLYGDSVYEVWRTYDGALFAVDEHWTRLSRTADALMLRLPFDAAVNARLPPFLTVYPAVVLASFAGGLRVGAGTAVIGGLLSWALWLAPYGYEIPSYGAITLAARRRVREQVRAGRLLADREDLAPDLVALLVLALPVELGVPGSGGGGRRHGVGGPLP